MTLTEEAYYKVKREIKQRVRDIFMSASRARNAESEGERMDALAEIYHSNDMIGFAFEEADKEIEAETLRMIESVGTNLKEAY